MEITDDTIYISRSNKLPQTYSYKDVQALYKQTFLELMEGIYNRFMGKTLEIQLRYDFPPPTQYNEQQLFVYAYVNPGKGSVSIEGRDEMTLKVGDPVKVIDAGLKMLRDFGAGINHHGWVKELDYGGAGDILVEFPIGDDDPDEHSQVAPYPASCVKPREEDPR